MWPGVVASLDPLVQIRSVQIRCDTAFDSQTRRHMWVEFVGSVLCTERFSPGTPGTPTFGLSGVDC